MNKEKSHRLYFYVSEIMIRQNNGMSIIQEEPEHSLSVQSNPQSGTNNLKAKNETDQQQRIQNLSTSQIESLRLDESGQMHMESSTTDKNIRLDRRSSTPIYLDNLAIGKENTRGSRPSSIKNNSCADQNSTKSSSPNFFLTHNPEINNLLNKSTQLIFVGLKNSGKSEIINHIFHPEQTRDDKTTTATPPPVVNFLESSSSDLNTNLQTTTTKLEPILMTNIDYLQKQAVWKETRKNSFESEKSGSANNNNNTSIRKHFGNPSKPINLPAVIYEIPDDTQTTNHGDRWLTRSNHGSEYASNEEMLSYGRNSRDYSNFINNGQQNFQNDKIPNTLKKIGLIDTHSAENSIITQMFDPDPENQNYLHFEKKKSLFCYVFNSWMINTNNSENGEQDEFRAACHHLAYLYYRIFSFIICRVERLLADFIKKYPGKRVKIYPRQRGHKGNSRGRNQNQNNQNNQISYQTVPTKKLDIHPIIIKLACNLRFLILWHKYQLEDQQSCEQECFELRTVLDGDSESYHIKGTCRKLLRQLGMYDKWVNIVNSPYVFQNSDNGNGNGNQIEDPNRQYDQFFEYVWDKSLLPKFTWHVNHPNGSQNYNCVIASDIDEKNLRKNLIFQLGTNLTDLCFVDQNDFSYIYMFLKLFLDSVYQPKVGSGVVFLVDLVTKIPYFYNKQDKHCCEVYHAFYYSMFSWLDKINMIFHDTATAAEHHIQTELMKSIDSSIDNDGDSSIDIQTKSLIKFNEPSIFHDSKSSSQSFSGASYKYSNRNYLVHVLSVKNSLAIVYGQMEQNRLNDNYVGMQSTIETNLLVLKNTLLQFLFSS